MKVQWVVVLGSFEGTETGGGGVDVLDIVGPFPSQELARRYGVATEGSFWVHVLQIPAKMAKDIRRAYYPREPRP